MKMSLKFYSVAIAALMALSSLAFVSCDKENDSITPNTEQVSNDSKSLQFQVDEVFRDSMERYWNMHGTGSWINVNGGRNGVYLNINFRQRGDDHIYYFKGQAIWNPTVDPVQFTIIPDGEYPTRLVCLVVREYSRYLLYCRHIF